MQPRHPIAFTCLAVLALSACGPANSPGDLDPSQGESPTRSPSNDPSKKKPDEEVAPSTSTPAPSQPLRADDAPASPTLHDAKILYEGAHLTVPNRVYSWGEAFQGQVFSNTFRVENSGKIPVKILEIKPKCGCTEASNAIKNFVLPPGKGIDVTLDVNTQAFSNFTRKDSDIIVEGNVEGDLKLWMQGDVKPLFLRSPQNPTLEVVRDRDAAQEASLPITLTTRMDGGVSIVSVRSEKGLLETSYRETRPGTVFVVDLRPKIDLTDKTVGHSDEIFIKSRIDGKEVEIQFPVSIQVRERIRVLPAKSVFFGPNLTKALDDPEAPLPLKVLEVQSLAGESHRFRITGMRVGLETSPAQHFDAKLTPVTEGRLYKLEVTLKRWETDTTTSRTVREKIHLTTDDPAVPEIVIPCTARLRSSQVGG